MSSTSGRWDSIVKVSRSVFVVVAFGCHVDLHPLGRENEELETKAAREKEELTGQIAELKHTLSIMQVRHGLLGLDRRILNCGLLPGREPFGCLST